MANSTTGAPEGVGDQPVDLGDQALSKYTLYETKSRFYVTASTSTHHRVLKIDRTTPEVLSVTEDSAVYDMKQLDLLLRMVDDGNKSAGGLEKVLDFHGILGFVKFTAGYYLVLCCRKSAVALLGGHYIFHCDETLLLAVSNKADRTAEETRLIHTFQQVDLSKNFYFSYSYDLTSSLQVNLTRPHPYPVYNTRFTWNYRLLAEAFELPRDEEEDVPEEARVELLDFANQGIGVEEKGKGEEEGKQGREGGGKVSCWVLPVIWGFVDQAKIPVLGRTVYITLIARRSRYHAGTRYLKRGVNDKGHVANEVETEQIVSEPLTTSFSLPLGAHGHRGDGRGRYPNYTSFVQIRGSIPLQWTQDNANMSPKPPIEIGIVDPFFGAAAKHFNDLLHRYGGPIVVVNLIKGKEAVPRESKLLHAYAECIAYLNQFLPAEENGGKIKYIAWDMAQATKTKSQDVIGILEDIAEEAISMTKFFHGGPSRFEERPSFRDKMQLQSGICRTNCIDCLDRTNAAQFSIGKKVLGHQLHALGVIATPDALTFESDVVSIMTEMYHDHGDTLAWQYTGSALVNRMDTYRRTKARQWSSHSRDILENVRRYYTNSMLDADKQVAMDLFLGIHPRSRVRPPTRRNYRHWFEEDALHPERPAPMDSFAPSYNLWVDYYKPHLLSQFQRIYAFTMNSTARSTAHGTSASYSPFESRIQIKSARRLNKKTAGKTGPEQPRQAQANEVNTGPQVSREPPHPLEGLVSELFNPVVSDTKRAEYEWYTLYQTNELLSSTNTAEPQDLQLYAQAAAISHGAPLTTLDEGLYERYVYGESGQARPQAELADSHSRSDSDYDE